MDAHPVQAACYKGCVNIGEPVVRLSRPESNGCDLGQKVYTYLLRGGIDYGAEARWDFAIRPCVNPDSSKPI